MNTSCTKTANLLGLYSSFLKHTALFNPSSTDQVDVRGDLIHVSLVCALSLRHQYILPIRLTTHELGILFRNLAIISLHRLPTPLQPQQLAQMFPNQLRSPPNFALLAGGFRPPEDSNWKYYNEEIVRHLKNKYPDLIREFLTIDR